MGTHLKTICDATGRMLRTGYIVAQYIDGDEEEPTRTECVDLYVENAMEKLKAYVFKLQQSKSSAIAT
jgi:hypothetical protein